MCDCTISFSFKANQEVKMKKSQRWIKVLLLGFLLLALVSCGRGEDPLPETPQATQPGAETNITATAQSVNPQAADIVSEALNFGHVRYQLNGDDMVCGKNRTVPEGLLSFTVANGQVLTSTQTATGLTTTGSSVFAKGSLYDLANRYCQVNSSVPLFVRASDIGNARE